MFARELGLKRVHAALEAQGRHHLGHLGVVAVVADAHRHLVDEINALHLLHKTMHEMLARLLSITDDIQACVFLRLDPQ
ncbi:hypothetical protein D3C71_1894530 [compost metagenome]